MILDLLRSFVALGTVIAIAYMLGHALWSKKGGLRYFYGFVLFAIFASSLFLPFDHDPGYGTLRFWFCYLALGYAALGRANFEVGPVDLLVELVTLAHTYICIRLSEIAAHRGILLLLRYMDSKPDSK